MNTATLTDSDAARAECTCAPCQYQSCPAPRLLDTIDNLVAALGTARGLDDAQARVQFLGAGA